MKTWLRLFGFGAILTALTSFATAQAPTTAQRLVHIRDLASVEGVRENSLIG